MKNDIPEISNIKGFKDLIVYQKGLALTNAIYKTSNEFPDMERYGLVSQAQRASSSICLNIAESCQLYLAKKINFLNNAFGSAQELRSILDIAYSQGYIDQATYNKLDNDTTEVVKLLFGMIKTISNNDTKSKGA